MVLDEQGHIRVTPAGVEEGAAPAARHRFINDVLIPGTPDILDTYARYCDFLEFFAERLGIHPRNIGMCGSGKIGFSIAPRADKLWGAKRPDSDIDLAIMDAPYYEFVDERIRDWEHRNEALVYRGDNYKKYAGRLASRSFYFLRYDDLPECLPCVQEFKQHINGEPSKNCRKACCPGASGSVRPMKAFIYRDWRSFYGKYQHDLHELCEGIKNGSLPHGGESPRII